jgi:hypothetical protein
MAASSHGDAYQAMSFSIFFLVVNCHCVPFLITDAELSLDNMPIAGWYWDEVNVTKAKSKELRRNIM